MIPLINRHNESECNISALKNNLIVDMWSLFFFQTVLDMYIIRERSSKNKIG